MPLLKIDNLKIGFSTYLGTVHAVRGVSFSVEAGETVAIVGESGCGKSVLMQGIVGLIPTPPGKIEGGSVLFQGEELLTKSKKALRSVRRKIGMIFQDPMSALNPTMRIGKQIEEARWGEGASVHELLEMVEITHPEKRMRQYPHELSGGQRQRVMIAIALASNPELLIADEPTTALDVTVQAQILDLLKRIQQERQMSILLITHDLGIVAALCERVGVMYAGNIVEIGGVDALFSSPAHPYTKGLLHAIPRLNLPKEQPLASIPGSPPNLLSPPSGCAFCARCPLAMQICKRHSPTLKKVSEHHLSSCWRNENA